ncbi:MAG: vWA domain-containing protein, partial [Planctomycetota bacterium]
FLPAGGPDPAELGPGVRVLVVDASASARRTRPAGWLPGVRATLAAEGSAAAGAGQEVAVVVFAAGVRCRLGPVSPGALQDALLGHGAPPLDPAVGPEEEGASELAAALRVALRLAADPARRRGEVVLLGEGDHTGEDPRPLVAESSRRGVPVRLVPPGPAERADLALRSLELPPRVEEGAPLVAAATLAWSPVLGDGEEGARLVVERATGEGVRSSAFPLVLPAGGGTWRVSLEIGPAAAGRTLATARVELARGPDPIPENDVAQASTRGGGELVVGVAAEAARLGAARAWLAPAGPSTLPGIQVVFTDLPGLAGLLPELDLLVTFDLPASFLDPGLLAAFVRGGRGWLATSGWRFLQDWHPGRPPEGLAALLPLAPADLEAEPRDVVLLMDGSGSMAGEPFEILRAAALDLVAAALPSDEVSLRFFTAGLGPATVIQARRELGAPGSGTSRAAAQALLAARVPGGRTYLFQSLEELAAERERSGVEALVLLLTDGRETDTILPGDLLARSARLRERWRASRTALVVIGVGEGVDEATLALLARPGEPVPRAQALGDLEAIFRREIHGAELAMGEVLPVHLAPRPGSPGPRTLAEEILGAGEAGEAPPPLAIAVRNRTREGAEALWLGPEGEPILGVARAGRGRTALLSTCPIEEWAPGWAGRPGGGEPRAFGPLLRWLGRRQGASGGEPTARVEGGLLRVDGLAEDWPAALGGRLVAIGAPTREGGAAAEVPLTLFPPAAAAGRDPRSLREALLPLETRRRLGTARVSLQLAGPGGETLLLPLDLGPAPEFASDPGRTPRVGGTAVGGVPAAGGVQVRTAEGPEGAGGAHPAAPGVLLAGLVLLFLAGLGRRLPGRPIKAAAPMVDR